jgi:hypothetical protein
MKMTTDRGTPHAFIMYKPLCMKAPKRFNMPSAGPWTLNEVLLQLVLRAYCPPARGAQYFRDRLTCYSEKNCMGEMSLGDIVNPGMLIHVRRRPEEATSKHMSVDHDNGLLVPVHVMRASRYNQRPRNTYSRPETRY